MATNTPAARPVNPRFSSGPCAKPPTFTLESLSDAALGRSHRAALGKAIVSPRAGARLHFALFRPGNCQGKNDDWTSTEEGKLQKEPVPMENFGPAGRLRFS